MTVEKILDVSLVSSKKVIFLSDCVPMGDISLHIIQLSHEGLRW